MSATSTTSIVIGTRGSQLATTQTGHVRADLESRWGADVDVRVDIIRTRGDVDRQSLSQIGGQGVFTREIEAALLDGRIDLAVHSLKDLPTEMDEALVLVATPERQDVRDVLITADGGSLEDLPEGARIGTGSARRQAQLLTVRPDLRFVDLRGNVDTRLRKVSDGEADAVILAAAGLRRLGLEDRMAAPLDPQTILPAPGQGALGLQMRRGDDARAARVAALDHADSAAAVTAERAFLAALGGGCRAPIAAWGRMESELLCLDGVVLRPDGTDVIRARLTGPPAEAADLGRRLGDELEAAGAAAILADYAA